MADDSAGADVAVSSARASAWAGRSPSAVGLGTGDLGGFR